MWNFLKSLLQKWSCHHLWERIATTYGYDPNLWDKATTVLIKCPKCGKTRSYYMVGKEQSDPHVTINIGDRNEKARSE